MISQAGLYKLTLYENKSFSFLYNADGTIDFDSISNTGDVLGFETNDNRNKYSNEIKTARNNDIVNSHKLEFWINGLIQSNLDTLEKLQSTIYGWVPVMEFMDNQIYLVNAPFFLVVLPFQSQVTHTFKLEMITRISSLRKLEEIIVSEGVVGLLDSNGSSQNVDLDSTPDITGNKTTTCKIYIPSTSTTSGEGLIRISDGGNDILILDAVNNNDTLRAVANSFLGFTDGVAQYDISSLKDSELSIEIQKTTRAITSFKINGVDNAVYSASGVTLGAIARFYGAPHIYMWNVDINSQHSYDCQPNGNQNSAYIDNTDSINGTVNGSPSTIDLP